MRPPTDPDGNKTSPEGRGSGLGPFLCWAVVFADLGSSVYYTPGILFAQPGVGTHAALFVAMTLVVFVLLTRKYGEVAVRYPEGGGVVTVAAHAVHPFVGVLGGMFILVDYYLTAALSALSGIIYLSNVVPHLAHLVLPVTLLALVLLGALNLIGISESAKVNAVIAVVAALSQVAVILAVVMHVGPGNLVAALPRVLAGPSLTPARILTGYAGAFLAFSGLESISQLSPAMAEPRRQVTRLAMSAVIGSMALTSPLLTLWSTTVLPITKSTNPNQFISLLGGFAAGRVLEIEVAISGALLLVFASNTAIIGSYHVFLALTRMGFLPKVIEQCNRWRGTPHWAILTVVAVPVLVLVAAQGSVTLLGDLYAFGLLGAFSLTCLALDIVRWHERHPDGKPKAAPEGGEGATGEGSAKHAVGQITFVVGVITTVLVTLAWTTNLFAKPLATLFGGGLTVAGLAIAATTYVVNHRRGRIAVVPVLHRPGVPVAFLSRGRRAPPATVLAILPSDAAHIEVLLHAAATAAAGGPVILLQRGAFDPPDRPPRLFEMTNPYLRDAAAQTAFSRAARRARQHGHQYRYLYVPRTAGPEAVAELWQALRPQQVLAIAGDADLLSGIAPCTVRHVSDGTLPIVSYVAQR